MITKYTPISMIFVISWLWTRAKHSKERSLCKVKSLIVILFHGFAKSASPPFMPLALHTDDIWYCLRAEGSPENLGPCSKGEATQFPYFYRETPNSFCQGPIWLISNGMRQKCCVKAFLLKTIFSSNQLIGCQSLGGFGEHETWDQGGNL